MKVIIVITETSHYSFMILYPQTITIHYHQHDGLGNLKEIHFIRFSDISSILMGVFLFVFVVV